MLGVHRSLFYYHRAQSKKPDITREALRRRVAELHQISRCSAGARTLSRLLRNEGKDVGRYKASQLMKEAGLASKQPGKHSYRVREHVSCLAGNNLDRCFRVDAPNKVWCGDITFIRTKAGWLYLAVVLDLYARKIVGWAFSSEANSLLAKTALAMAWQGRGCPEGVMFHSDQGTQYGSLPYRTLAAQYGMMLSMSRSGNCWDNAVAERLFRSLKTEWIPRGGYRDRNEAAGDIVKYLSGYYNRIRPHKNNGGLSPVGMERQRLLECVQKD